MHFLWFWYDFDMISIWFCYDFVMANFMIFLWFWAVSDFSIWFCYGLRGVQASWPDMLCCLLSRVLLVDGHTKQSVGTLGLWRGEAFLWNPTWSTTFLFSSFGCAEKNFLTVWAEFHFLLEFGAEQSHSNELGSGFWKSRNLLSSICLACYPRSAQCRP